MFRTIIVVVLFMLSLNASADGTMLLQAQHLLDQALLKESNYNRCCAAQAIAAAIDIAAAPLLGFSLIDLGCNSRIRKANKNRNNADKMHLTIKSLERLIEFLSEIKTAHRAHSEGATVENNSSGHRNSKNFQEALMEMKSEGETDRHAIKRIYKINRRGDNRLENLEIAQDYYKLMVSEFNKGPKKKKKAQ